jgi:hypothetical protein
MTAYLVPPSVLRASIDTEEVLLNTSTGRYHVLNETGRAVVATVVAGRTPAEAALQLAADTGASEEMVRRDVDAFIDALVDRGLLHVVH